MAVTAYDVDLLFANNAQSTLAGSISDSQTTINLASGGGARFPALTAGQGFAGTITDTATGLLREIVLVTDRVGDTLTVVRAQEGTTGLAWAANDLFAQLCTAGDLTSMVQAKQLQAQAGNYGDDIGAVNAYQIVLDPALTDPSEGTPVLMKAANSNTGDSTLDAGDGAVQIIRNDGSALIGGEIVADGIYRFFRNGAKWQLGGAVGTSLLVSGQAYFQRNSATTCKLMPFNGNNVPVDGDLVPIPAAGISVANTNVTVGGVAAQNLVANTTYLVALDKTGVLEYWSLATGHNADNTTGNVGVEVITGHPTKSLVGLVTTNSSAQFTFMNVVSWFNPQDKTAVTNMAASNSTTSLTPVEISTQLRIPFSTFATRDVEFIFVGSTFTNTGGVGSASMLAIDTVVQNGGSASGTFAGVGINMGFNDKKLLSEGAHTSTLYGNVGGADTGWWLGGTAAGAVLQTVTISG